MTKVYIKIHKNSMNEVIAVCDQDILGKKFQKGDLCIMVSEGFYNGELVDIDDALKVLEHSANFNIVGKNIVDAAIEHGVVSKDGIISVDSIPLAMKFVL